MDADAFNTLLRTRAQLWLWATLLVACGVQEHSHNQASVSAANDFGPSKGNTGPKQGPTSPAASAGTQAVANGAAANGSAGAIGSGAPAGSGTGGRAATGAAAGMAAGASAGTTPSTNANAGSAATPPPASGVTLDLGGTPVAKEDAIAIIHIGHSNMAGRATGPSATRPYFFTQTDPHAWMYHVGKPPALAQEPYTAEDDLSGFYGGPGTAIMKQAAAMWPNKYFISLGFGKESAYCTQFLPGALYYDSLIQAALAIKDRVTFGAIVIMLGITERHGTQADITGYSNCINQLVTAIRKDVGVPDLPLLITDYEQEATGALATTGAFAQQIIPEIHKIPMVVSNSVLVPTDGLGMQDDHHFNFDGHKTWTGRVVQLIKDNGWDRWAQ